MNNRKPSARGRVRLVYFHAQYKDVYAIERRVLTAVGVGALGLRGAPVLIRLSAKWASYASFGIEHDLCHGKTTARLSL